MTIILTSATFIGLSADIQPEILENLDWHSWAVLGLVVFVIRPVSIFASTIGSRVELCERWLLGWIAPRGIVAAVDGESGLFFSPWEKRIDGDRIRSVILLVPPPAAS